MCVLFQLQLWSTKTGEQIVCFYHAEKPVFTLDCKYLLYIDSGQTLITYCLNRMAPMRYIACKADQLLVLPVKHRLVLMTNWTSCASSPNVTLWDFHEGRQLINLSNVAIGGIRDISKDGMFAVDANIQVFNLDTGALKSHVDHNPEGDKDFSFVRLTDDGQYVVWVDKLFVKVSRTCDGALIAHACTHECPTSLCTLDCGYVLVVGREDGRILMMKLLPDCQQSLAVCRPHDAEERCRIIHSCQMCSDKVKASFDIIYQYSAHSVRDGELQRASESIRGILTQRAKAPLLSTAMSKATDATANKYRRSYSQLTPISDLHESGRLTAASSYHDIASSSSCLDDLSPVAAYRCSADDSAVLTYAGDENAEMMRRHSRSVTDVMALCTHKQRDVSLQSRGTTLPHATSKSSPAGATSPPLRVPAHKFLSYFWDFRANIRSRRKKCRRQLEKDTDSRDRMPSV